MVKEIILPKGFEVDKIEDGKIILKEVKSKYPETWEECLIRLNKGEYIDMMSRIHPLCGLGPRNTNEAQHNILPEGYGKKVLALCQLLICREVYWNGWKPNWTRGDSKYCLRTGAIIGTCTNTVCSHILSFPTKEMRDAFYRNFKDLIEEAKDLI